MSISKSLHLSTDFAISAGTCTIDPRQQKLLIIHRDEKCEHFLPKGRKDIGETLLACAVRETFEETGHRVVPLPLPIETLHTRPQKAEEGDDTAAAGAAIYSNTEPVAVTQRDVNGVRKIIFWFAAGGDSTVDAASDRPRQEGEEGFEARWVDWSRADSALSFDDDRRVAAAVLDVWRRCTLRCSDDLSE